MANRINMATIKINCPDCGALTDWHIGQAVVGNELVWHGSHRCAACNSCCEEDDYGFPPEKTRNAILDQEGRWELTIGPPGAEKAKVIAILRKTLQLSLAEISNLMASVSGTVYTGTQAEAQWLEQQLRNQNVKVEITVSHRID